MADVKDFRSYLKDLEEHGLLKRVSKPIDIKFEIAAGIRKISDTNGPALLFDNIKGFPGWRVAGGVYATRRLMACALQTEENDRQMMQRYLDIEGKTIKPVMISTGPCKEVILKGDDVDLTKLPIPTYCERDIGPYITAGVEIGRHPETGVQNISIHRRQILGKNKTSVLVRVPGHLACQIIAAEEKGIGLPIATALGVHPAITLASQLHPRLGVDEMDIAGGIRGRPIELVKCETIDVNVPADAEMVIEGVTVPGERIDDGPFGEFPGDYISLSNLVAPGDLPTQKAPVIKVTAVTMRHDPIFHAMLTGMPVTENQCLSKWAGAAGVYRTAVLCTPYAEDIRGVHTTAAGSGHHHVVISIKKRTEAIPRNIIYNVLTKHWSTGLVIVVDEDVNPYDPAQVEWAVSTTRVSPEKDIIILPTIPLAENQEPIITHCYKWGIDATAPLCKNRWVYSRAVPPGVDKVDYV